MNNTTPKLLFVDQEQQTLQILQKLLLSEDWDCAFVSSAAEALDFLQTKPCDMMISDVQTARTADVHLFDEIHTHYPKIIRIYLSTYSNRDSIAKILSEGYGQQIIPKPWVDQELKEVIRSAIRQSHQQKKHSDEFQALINSIPLLPSLPESYSNVRSCIVGDEIDIEKMSIFISQDVAIASALLHWANSALFGQRFQVDTLKKAIVVLGTDIVENLILSESVNRTIASELPEIDGFSFKRFKKHSIATAILSRLLIKSILPTDSIQHDRAFVAGLLHDMGKLAMASFFPKQFEEAIKMATDKKCPLPTSEIDILGTQHAEFGSFLAEWWALPPFISNAICWHHHPHSSSIDQDIIAAAHVANLLSYQFGYGSNGETYQREILDEYQTRFYLTDEATEILRAETVKTIQGLTTS